MKKFLMVVAAAVAVVASSCVGSAEAECEAYLKTIDSTTAAVENCKDAAEFEAIAKAFEVKAKDFEAKYANETCSADLQKKIEEAADRYLEVAKKKGAELTFEAVLKSVESATEEALNSKSTEELETITKNFEAKTNEIAALIGDDSTAVSAELEKKLEAASQKYLEVVKKRAEELAK